MRVSGMSIAMMAVIALAGCSEEAQEASRTRYQAPAQGKELSPAVKLTAAGQKMPLAAAVPTQIVFDPSDSTLSSAGRHAECTLTSAAFTARVSPSTRLNLPSFGRQTPPMTVQCAAGSYQLERIEKAVNLTERSYGAEAAGHMLIGFGLIGAAVSGAQASNRDKSKDLYGYPQQIKLSVTDKL